MEKMSIEMWRKLKQGKELNWDKRGLGLGVTK